MLRSCMFILVSSLFLVLPQAQSQEEPPPNLVPDVDIQASGPVHEAFAQPFDGQPEPGPIVPKQPPPVINELPPEERPEGDDIQWIPGYWAWDSEKSDYLWISGTYRKTPSDRQFVPGYWTESGEGWRWIAGYWAPTNQPEVQYTPQPPATLENGPSVPGPDDSVYVPGYWSYQNTTFAWRPGYWSSGYDNRIWITPSYRWSPAGYVFVNGYWDYPFADRGLLFAPAYFSRPLWHTPGWCYRPYYTVNSGLFLNCLFYRPAFGFYFGNFFGNNWAGRGYRPWYASHHSPYSNYYRWQNRRNPGWYAGMQNSYAQRASGNLPVPPRTLAQQQQQKDGTRFGNVIAPFNKQNDVNIRLTRQDATQLKVQKANIERGRELAQQRHQFEAKAGPAPSAGGQTRSFKLPPSGTLSMQSPKNGNNTGPGNFKDHPLAGSNNPAKPLPIDRDGPKGGFQKKNEVGQNNPGPNNGQPRIFEGKGPGAEPRNTSPVKPQVGSNPNLPRVLEGKGPGPNANLPPGLAKPSVGANNNNIPRILEGPGANAKNGPPVGQPRGPQIIQAPGQGPKINNPGGGQSPFRGESFAPPPQPRSIQVSPPNQGRSIQGAPPASKIAPQARPAAPRASAPVSRPAVQQSRPAMSVRPSAAPSRPPAAKGGGGRPAGGRPRR